MGSDDEIGEKKFAEADLFCGNICAKKVYLNIFFVRCR